MATAIKDREVTEQHQYLTFLLAGEEYAIGILEVKEIIEYDTVTAVPRTPKWIRGVINLRGSVVPVVDLAVKFGLDQKPVTKTTCIVIVETHYDHQSTTMGVIADAVSQVMDIASGDVQEVPDFGTRIQVDYLQGMAQLGKKFVLLLDIGRVLSGDEALDLTEATQAHVEESTTSSLETNAVSKLEEGGSSGGAEGTIETKAEEGDS